MENTIIYLIRHAETVDEDGIRNTDENSQFINEKEILSVEGEKQAKQLSECDELKDIDIIWSSSYTRAKATAKYIAYKNNIQYNLDKRLCERKLGNVEDLAKFMNDKETRDPSREQLSFPEFKTRDGESANDTNRRMTNFIEEILEKYKEKKIAIISHGGAIKFYLLSHCNVNNNLNLEYKGKELIINSPCLLKLIFSENNLLNIEQVEYKLRQFADIKVDATKYIRKEVCVKIDRPIGSSHPKYPDHIYLVNYGYVPNTVSGDGEELDCYVLGEHKPLKEFTGKCIAVIHRLNDNDDKLVIVPDGKSYTDSEIRLLTEFQEKYFESEILR